MAFLSIGILAVFMWIALFMVILLFIGTIILQVFLSRMKNPWAGLILPGFILGFIFLLCTMAPDFSTALLMLSKGNIPTAIYLMIYFFFRKRKKKSDSALQIKRKDEINGL